ncbi:DUF6069 family protein [Amycolatopsis sp. cg9]|uniref:DUF6069 family protein n=1 Tax=Amycolatopsis sp. cg9 TaxID=3238801 RepID=UPI003526B0F9
MTRPTLVAGRLWAGGAATALVAALAAILAVIAADGLFGVPVLAPSGENAWSSVDIASYAAGAALAALAATGLLHLLLISTPRAKSFFVSIMLLATVIAVIVPVTLDSPGRLATAAGNLLVGLVITGTLSGVAAAAVRPAR